MGKEGKHVNIWRSNSKGISSCIQLKAEGQKKNGRPFLRTIRLLVRFMFLSAGRTLEAWSAKKNSRAEQEVSIRFSWFCLIFSPDAWLDFALLYRLISFQVPARIVFTRSLLAIRFVLCLSPSLVYRFHFLWEALMVQQRPTFRICATFARPSRLVLIWAFSFATVTNVEYDLIA